MSRRALLLLTLLFEGGLLGLAWVAGTWLETPLSFPTQPLWISLAWGLLFTAPLLGALAFSVKAPWKPFETLRQHLEDIVARLFSRATLLDLLLISLFAGLGEEALFRGVLQPYLSEHLGIGAGLLLASLLFGLAHYLSLTYALYATLVGVYLGLLFVTSGDLVLVMTTHAAYDFVALCVLTRSWAPEAAEEQ